MLCSPKLITRTVSWIPPCFSLPPLSNCFLTDCFFPPQHFLSPLSQNLFNSYWIYSLMFHIIRILPQGSAICTFLKTIKDIVTYLKNHEIVRILECQCGNCGNLICGKTYLSTVNIQFNEIHIFHYFYLYIYMYMYFIIFISTALYGSFNRVMSKVLW